MPKLSIFQGVSLAKGKGGNRDQKLVTDWCKKSTEQGDAEAQYELGTIYFKGIGIEKNSAEAWKWIKAAFTWIAAEKGHIDAQYQLGYLYEKGFGITQDTNLAILWYNKAAKNNHPQAKKRINQPFK